MCSSRYGSAPEIPIRNEILMFTILCSAFALFCSCLAIHIMVWRALPVQQQGIRLGLIFLVCPVAGLVLWHLASSLSSGWLRPLQWRVWLLAYLLQVSLSGAYLFLYTAVTGFSPSIAILERVEESMPTGLKRDQLAPKWFTDTNLSGARRENLLATGFIIEANGRLRLSPRGWLIATCFLMFRRFLGLSDMARG
jgi:hypothetical protein